MGKNKNGKQKQKLEEVPEEEEEEEEEEYYDYSAEEEEGYGLDMLGGEDNWATGATAGQYDPWGGTKPGPQPVGSSQWGNTIPTPAQLAAQHAAQYAAAANANKGGGGGGGGGKKGNNNQKGDKKGGGKPQAQAWEAWGMDNRPQAAAEAWGVNQKGDKKGGGKAPQAWEMWGKDPHQQQQPATDAWGNHNTGWGKDPRQQQQPAADTWGNHNTGWGKDPRQQQQPAADTWGNHNTGRGKDPRQQQQPAADTWGNNNTGRGNNAWGGNTGGLDTGGWDTGGWGAGSTDATDWGVPIDETRWETTQQSKHAQQQWGWGDETKRLPKVTSVPDSVGLRNDLAAQQRSEILQALLNHPNQGHDVRSAYEQQKGGQYDYQKGGGQYENQKGGDQQKGGKKQQKKENKQKNKKNQQQQGQQKQRQNDPWANGGWDDGGGWGMPEEDDYDEYHDMEDRRVHFTPITSNLWGGSQHDSTYNMPSKTLAHAQKGTTTPLFTGLPRNKVSESADVQFVDSKGAALKFVHQALFGKTRMAKDRIHWMFPPNKDERVSSLLAWIETMSYNLGAYGLHRFLQSRERGALFANADYRPSHSPNEPAFDWLTFDQLQTTRDRVLQESVAFYDPAVTCIVFVFLPSKSGNSVAMWRRKITVGNNTRASRINEIHLAMAGLRREKDYVVHVDEIPGAKLPATTKTAATGKKATPHKYDYDYEYSDYSRSYYPYETAIEKKPKKRKWWHFF